MTQALLMKLKTEYPNAKITNDKNDKYTLRDFLIKGIHVELMLTNSNAFVIRYGEFAFFDLLSLQHYFQVKLLYQDVNFEINSDRIYVYINFKKDILFQYQVFKYVMKEITDVMNKISDFLYKSA